MQWDHHCRSPLDVCDVILEALGDPGQCLGHLCLKGLSMHGEAPLRLVQLGAFDPELLVGLGLHLCARYLTDADFALKAAASRSPATTPFPLLRPALSPSLVSKIATRRSATRHQS